MFTSYKIFIRTTATIEQLKGFGKTLEQWSNNQPDAAGCRHIVDYNSLDDLLAGELPKPEFLGVTDSFRHTIEEMKLEGMDITDLLPDYLAEFRRWFPDTKRRNINVLVEHSLECSHQPFKCGYDDVIQDLIAAVDDGLIEDVEAGSMPHPPLPQQ